MRALLSVLYALPVLLLSGCGSPPEPAGERGADPATQAVAVAPRELAAIDLTRYRERVATLASDAFEGRGPASVGERKTVPWLVEQFRALGLQPGNGDSYTQAVPMVELLTEPTQPFTVQTPEGPLALVQGTDVVTVTRRTTPTVSVADLMPVFVGYGVSAPELGWDDYADVDVRGKLVITLVNDPGFHRGDESLFRGRAMTYYGRWTYKYEEAERRGAAAVLIVHDDAGAGYGWEVVKNGAARPQFDLPRAADAPPGLAVQGWLSTDAATRLFAAAGKDFAALKRAAGVRDFQAELLTRLKASVSLASTIRTASSDNVLALIPGRSRPDEVVVYTAHWDHLGRNFQMTDGVFNGAIDNATGTAALISIAEAMQAGPPPERSVLFLAVTLEESGLLGSRHYTERPVFPLAQTVAAINIDALQAIGPAKDVIVVGYGASELEDLLAREATARERYLRPEPKPETGGYYRSDHFNFARMGVPSLYIKTGWEHRTLGEEYGRTQIEAYGALRYHKPQDELAADADLSGIVEDLALLHAVGDRLANDTVWPQWYPGNEFRAVREASRAPR
ncbi:MAG: M28 family peptidase [Xanthomonadales bacterium]|jgi:Zn-dependent M28 family amino/carboxypeptidase|nr:M28 family peptidase [Xanthomonadales bacterium]